MWSRIYENDLNNLLIVWCTNRPTQPSHVASGRYGKTESMQKGLHAKNFTKQPFKI